MIIEGKIDYDLSEDMLDKNQCDLRANFCYNNMIALMEIYYKEFRSGEYCIGFGYVGSKDTLFVRHAYIITSENKIIDPSILFKQREGVINHATYYTFAKITSNEYDSLTQEFMEMYSEEEFDPALPAILAKEEFEFYSFAVKNELPIYEPSYELYLKKFDRCDKIVHLTLEQFKTKQAQKLFKSFKQKMMQEESLSELESRSKKSQYLKNRSERLKQQE